MKLLAGGNPQIAKGEGDAPVQAYISAMPGWKRDVGKRLDALITRNAPKVRKAVKWNSPFYGIEGKGWFFSFHVFTKYVKIGFFRGAALKPVPHFNFAPLENAVDRLKQSAKAYDTALIVHAATMSPKTASQLFEQTRETEESLAPDTGLPGRGWYKNLMYAPGAYTGYSAKTLPGVREAIEEERWADADRYVAITAAALQSYADKLDHAVQLMNAPNATAAR